jgi:hypothetical protein
MYTSFPWAQEAYSLFLLLFKIRSEITIIRFTYIVRATFVSYKPFFSSATGRLWVYTSCCSAPTRTMPTTPQFSVLPIKFGGQSLSTDSNWDGALVALHCATEIQRLQSNDYREPYSQPVGQQHQHFPSTFRGEHCVFSLLPGRTEILGTGHHSCIITRFGVLYMHERHHPEKLTTVATPQHFPGYAAS